MIHHMCMSHMVYSIYILPKLFACSRFLPFASVKTLAAALEKTETAKTKINLFLLKDST